MTSPEPLDDSRSEPSLVAAAAQDRRQFVAVYDAYAQKLLLFVTKRVLDVELAFELVSESLAIALEHCGQFRGTVRAEDEAWLFAIARNVVNAYWRRGGIERNALARLQIPRIELEDASLERIEELSEIHALAPAAREAFDKLPNDQREAVQLRVIDELSYDEIARRLGVTREVVRARVSRGLRIIAKHLKDEDRVENVA